MGIKKIYIFNYANQPCLVEIPSFGVERTIEDIERITVEILSGDEIVTIRFKDGFEYTADSSSERTYSYYDGEYELTKKESIISWLDYGDSAADDPVFHDGGYLNTPTISYSRLIEFGCKEITEEDDGKFRDRDKLAVERYENKNLDEEFGEFMQIELPYIAQNYSVERCYLVYLPTGPQFDRYEYIISCMHNSEVKSPEISYVDYNTKWFCFFLSDNNNALCSNIDIVKASDVLKEMEGTIDALVSEKKRMRDFRGAIESSVAIVMDGTFSCPSEGDEDK